MLPTFYVCSQYFSEADLGGGDFGCLYRDSLKHDWSRPPLRSVSGPPLMKISGSATAFSFKVSVDLHFDYLLMSFVYSCSCFLMDAHHKCVKFIHAIFHRNQALQTCPIFLKKDM